MKAGHTGWAGVFAIVAVADLVGDRTMSEIFRECSRHPVGRPVLIVTWTALTMHLFGLVPADRDPICLASNPARRWFSNTFKKFDSML
jgi:hypothetical protein